MKQVTKLKWEGWVGKESRSLAGAGLGICVHGAVGVQSWERTELGKDRAGKGQSSSLVLHTPCVSGSHGEQQP